MEDDNGAPSCKKIKLATGLDEDLQSEKQGYPELEEIKEVITKLQSSLTKEKKNQDTVDRWKKELEDLQKRTSKPKLTVAVVGATGTGKSSLINAVIEHFDVLPASCSQSCTSVVVNIENNDVDNLFKGEVKFMSREDWEKEKEMSIQDLPVDKNGKIKWKKKSETNSPAHIARLKMEAVYGSIQAMEDIEKENRVLKFIGEKHTVKDGTVSGFKKKINGYIESTTAEDGQYWPLIEYVTVLVPNFITGCTLVDLPGVGDANAAREHIAEEYIKKCTSILVVSRIDRAFSDKVAKELCDSSFRRQLFMDGHYGNIGFVCTMNDDHLKISDFSREFKEESKATEDVQKEIEQLREELHNLDENEDDFKYKKLDLEDNIDKKTKKVLAEYAKARSQQARKQLKKQFREGLNEMKNPYTDDEDTEESSDSDDETNENISDDINQDHEDENLCDVFCVSSGDYQKIKEKDKTMVFDDEDATGIPEVRKWIYDLYEKKKEETVTDLVTSLDKFVKNVYKYLTVNPLKTDQEIIKQEVEKTSNELKEKLNSVMKNLKEDLEAEFKKINEDLEKGERLARDHAIQECQSWAGDHGSSGLKWPTYKACINRNGVYKSRAAGVINFNAKLVDQMVNNISVRWHNFFQENLKVLLDGYKDKIMRTLKDCNDNFIQNVVGSASSDLRQSVLEDIIKLLLAWLEKGNQELKMKIADIMTDVECQQREISRLFNPMIQARLQPTYESCKREKGKNMFKRIKEKIRQGIEENKDKMFKEITGKVSGNLNNLQEKAVVQELVRWCTAICENLCISFQPLFTSSEDSAELRKSILNDVKDAARDVDDFCKRCNITPYANSETASQSGTSLLYKRV